MTGAGSGSVAWASETSYNGGTAADPTFYGLGTNVQTQTAELTRNLLRIYAPGDVEAQNTLAQNLSGQLGLQFILKNDEFHRLIFNDGFTSFTSGLANSAEVYLGCDYASGTTERQFRGWAPASATIAFNGATETVQVTLSGGFATEEKNTSLTPGTVQRAGDEVPGFGTTLSIDGTDVGERLQSATLSFEQISRLQTGASQTPIEAVAGNVQESIEMAAIYDGPELYERALGSTGASTIEDDVDEVSGSLSFDANGSTVADYSFTSVAPDVYGWEGVLDNEADTQESITLVAHGVSGSDPTA
jgi:hypothetical protein